VPLTLSLPPKCVCPTVTSGGRKNAIKGLSPPLTFINGAIREPNAIYLAEKCIRKFHHMLMLSKAAFNPSPGIWLQQRLAMPFQAADPKTEEQPCCNAYHSTKPFCCFVHDRRHILGQCKRIFRNEEDYCTFFLYRVVTLVANTPFLMLLVAR
jgi:hypothetical protein